MAMIKKPPDTVERHIRSDEPVSQLLDDDCRFVDCITHYVTYFALRKMLARDPKYKKRKASQTASTPSKAGSDSSHPRRTA